MNMVDPGSRSQNGPVTVTKVAPWAPKNRKIVDWDSFGNPIFEDQKVVTF